MHYSTILVAVGLATQGAAECSRGMLQKATAAYVHTQSVGLPNSGIMALASNVSYAENDTPMDINTGVLTQPITIDFNRSLHDTVECATFTELTAATNEHPYVIHTRMLFTDDEISTIQSVVSDDGDWVFNATGHLLWNRQETWDVILEEKRDTRAVIQRAGDLYLDSWSDASVQVPYGTPCARLEGGAYTGNKNLSSNTCTMGQFPEKFEIGNRRYVIDEQVGAVGIFNDFPWIDTLKPNGTASTNLVRVEKGRIRYIHEVTICTTRNCGR